MASTYLRDNSPFIWIRFKDAAGKWKAKATRFRRDNLGDRRQAELLARKQSLLEREQVTNRNSDHWDIWVDSFLRERYGTTSTTAHIYRRRWRELRAWLVERGILTPAQLTYSDVIGYKDHRLCDGVSVNTAVHELKCLSVIMGRAIQMGMTSANPCRNLRIRKDPPKPKEVWPDDAIRTVGNAAKAAPDLIQATFLLGRYQAARLRQCEVPLRDIDFARRRITYWKTLNGRPLTKGDKPFTQPIATAATPWLMELVERRRSAGHEHLCDLGLMPSVIWRNFLDELGYPKLSHHGLRTTWITRAAQSGKISLAEAKAFVNHGSTAVHEIYQRLNGDDLAHVADAMDLAPC